VEKCSGILYIQYYEILAMKKIHLLSVVFSLILVSGLSAGTAVTYAESDDNNNDFEDKLEDFCSMTDEQKDQLFEEYPNLVQHGDLLNQYCSLDEDEREDLIEQFIEENYPNYQKEDDWDIEDALEKYCKMSADEKEAFIENYPMAADHQDELEEYCSLNESEREEFISEHEDEYKMDHGYEMEDILEKYCSMNDEEKAAFIEEHDKDEDHQAEMEEYCSLDESQRKAFIEEHEDEYKMERGYVAREKMDNFCEMSDEERAKHLSEYGKSEEHLAEMEEYCSLDDSEKNAFISEHKDTMKEKTSEHKDTMKEKISEHKDTMKEKTSEHKYPILRASKLTEEQKSEIKAMHLELRDFKHSLRDKSVSDSEKELIRDQFMEKAKEFSMTWLSPRYQLAAGIDSDMVECREGFELVMKTSNASPLCVKESSVETLVKRGIVISTT